MSGRGTTRRSRPRPQSRVNPTNYDPFFDAPPTLAEIQEQNRRREAEREADRRERERIANLRRQHAREREREQGRMPILPTFGDPGPTIRVTPPERDIFDPNYDVFDDPFFNPPTP